MPFIDLNIDLGELPSEPEDLYALATVANIACGGHAGDEHTMTRALSLAAAHGTRPAAHPSYPDRPNFGRTRIDIDPAELTRSIAEQCSALQRIAVALSLPLTLLKPHGALYHAAASDPSIAKALLDGALLGLSQPIITIVGPPHGALHEEAKKRGLPYAREGFADRAYLPDGNLVPRSAKGALLATPQDCARQAIELASSGRFDTLCLHGDTPGALENARAVRAALEQHAYLAPPRPPLKTAT